MYTNKVKIIGKVKNNLELKTGKSGTEYLNFYIQTIYSYTNKSGELVENKENHNIIVFGPYAHKIVLEFKLDSWISVVGRLQTKEFLRENVKVSATTIVLEQFSADTKSDEYNQDSETSESVVNYD